MKKFVLPFFIALLTVITLGAQQPAAARKAEPAQTISQKTADWKAFKGFFNFYWDETAGKIWLEVDKWDTEFLYINSLSAGVGSNDIGLDRNQLGRDRVVKFSRIGPKVLLVQPNYDYRANSDNPDEKASVAEAFAQSVLYGFKVEAAEGDKALIDLTPFLMEDAHNVADRLRTSNQGTYKVDANRSAIYLDRTRNFPKNSEFETILTFTGDPKGAWIRSVTPSPESVTVREHHSFVELPDAGYTPREYDPRSGYFPTSYYDYATPIDQPLVKRFITRHRLEKKDPSAPLSEPVKPIIYYLDRGTPEPVRSALLEGARWWNQAYTAAGYKDAFRVEILPEGADPMDVRYNMINWVHRSTRGWSYGSSVVDPRTGEIIKGHVLLGSLRVRQDFMIAQGLIDAYEDGTNPDPRMMEMALARLRQLSAHEVGHTLGLAHNYASSYNNRASVMDYPHPYITLKDDGSIDFSQAYDTGIGEWDKRAILYGYQDFAKGTDEKKALNDILSANIKMGLFYLTDQDGRPASSAHPFTHLWDNGKSAAAELKRLIQLRKAALTNFSENNIPAGTPMATLENILVPLYLMPRYQIEAAAKVVGGVNYTYAVRGDGQPANEPLDGATQRTALNALLETLTADYLALPDQIVKLIPPQPPGYRRDRELFKNRTGSVFDPLGAAESSAQHTISFLLNTERLARLVEQQAAGRDAPGPEEIMDRLWKAGRNPSAGAAKGLSQEIGRTVEFLTVAQLIQVAADNDAAPQVSALALYQLDKIRAELEARSGGNQTEAQKAHNFALIRRIGHFFEHPEDYKAPDIPALPDGSPIGCDGW